MVRENDVQTAGGTLYAHINRGPNWNAIEAAPHLPLVGDALLRQLNVRVVIYRTRRMPRVERKLAILHYVR
jgi:hypothetical protein